MQDRREQTTQSRRRHDRVPLVAPVSIEFSNQVIRGSAENVSSAGVYFIAEGELSVKVHIEGHGEAVDARLVRVEAIEPGKTGIAVKFEERGGSPTLPAAVPQA